LGFKHIEVTSLTFQGNVTSSVTWNAVHFILSICR